MITLKIPINLDEQQTAMIKSLQKAQSSVIRSAYSLAIKDIKEKEIRHLLTDRFQSNSDMDSWFIDSAVKRGLDMNKADLALNRTKQIFGNRNQFIRRAKGLITKEEWQESRLMPIYLIGEAPQKGNRKFDFLDDRIIFKPKRGVKIEILLPRLRKNWGKKYQIATDMVNQKQIPITVSLTATHICLSFKEPERSEPMAIQGRYAGIDMNPNYIGVSVFQSGVLMETQLFKLKELTGKGASASKLEHETREIAHHIAKWLKHLRVDHLFLENLSFKQGDKGLGRNFNRLTQNQWKKTTFRAILSKYFKIYDINAAYSSTIGNILHPNLPDPIAASAEIARRGYALVILKNKQFYPAMPSKTYLEDLWKETDIPDVTCWKELHSRVKDSKLKYRVPIPDMGFRFFSSEQSNVYVL